MIVIEMLYAHCSIKIAFSGSAQAVGIHILGKAVYLVRSLNTNTRQFI